MSYTPPEIGQEDWGTPLNQALDDIDTTAETAQSTADGKVSPGDLATVATSGAYSDLSGRPAIPDSYDDVGAASAAQGALADSATQPGDLDDVATSGAYADLSGAPAIPDDGDYVALTGDQTIDGVKRFNDSPLVPVPALGESDRAVNLGYVDALNYTDVGALPDTYTPPDQSWNQITGKPSTFPPSPHSEPWSSVTGKPSTFPPSPHDHDADDITTGSLPSVRGGTGLEAGDIVFGDYLTLTGTGKMDHRSPSAVRSDIGAAEEVASPIGWTNISPEGPASLGQGFRVRRHATGQVEIQAELDIDSSFSNGDDIGSLPSWATPEILLAINPGTQDIGRTARVNITTSSRIQLFAAVSGTTMGFVRFVAVYTP